MYIFPTYTHWHLYILYIKICIYLIHIRKNTAGFILVLSSSIHISILLDLIIFNISTYWTNSFLCTTVSIASTAWPDPLTSFLFRLSTPLHSLKNCIFESHPLDTETKTCLCVFGCAAACRIIVPNQTQAYLLLQAQSPNHWTARNFKTLLR